METRVYTAPEGSGVAIRGKTLPQLMYEACERYENPRALNQLADEEWRAYSLEEFREASEETALGLIDVGLTRGDRVAMYMESDVHFCIADMGCLLAGMIDVPIYLTHGPDQIRYVIDHCEATAVFVANLKRLEEIRDVLAACGNVRLVVVADVAEEERLPSLRGGVETTSLTRLLERGRRRREEQADEIRTMHERISPDDLATIIYTSGTTGKPKGVMLSHENISFNALTSFSSLSDYRTGPDGEIALSFLPLSHVFARALQYGFVYHATSVYFTTPERLSRDLGNVRPTIFATVPRVLEKVYGTIVEKSNALSGPRRVIAQWALRLGERYEIGREPAGVYKLQLALADRLVFKKWRAALGGRVRHVIAGGAALSPHLANLYAAAGIEVLQGYGLTETSPVVTFNRPQRNRAGTVGEPIPGVEVKIDEDGEILTRGPHVMKGYFKDPQATKEAIDPDGWFHTGDVGEFTNEGFLRITDRKKDLFKLSTGKYVTPQPIENRLTMQPLVEQAVVVGNGRPFSTVLIFPDLEGVRTLARSLGLDTMRPVEELVQESIVQDRFRQIVDEANRGMDPWSRVKRFRVVADELTTDDGMLTPTMKVRRKRVQEHYADAIESLYETDDSADVVSVERRWRPEAA